MTFGLFPNGLRALVVDDDIDCVLLLRVLLEGQGVEVLAAYSAQEALQVIEQFPADVLISDLAMPKEDGFMLIEKLKMLYPEAARRIKAIAMSAYVNHAIEQDAIAAGFDAFMLKPLEPESLLRALFCQVG